MLEYDLAVTTPDGVNWTGESGVKQAYGMLKAHSEIAVESADTYALYDTLTGELPVGELSELLTAADVRLRPAEGAAVSAREALTAWQPVARCRVWARAMDW